MEGRDGRLAKAPHPSLQQQAPSPFHTAAPPQTAAYSSSDAASSSSSPSEAAATALVAAGICHPTVLVGVTPDPHHSAVLPTAPNTPSCTRGATVETGSGSTNSTSSHPCRRGATVSAGTSNTDASSSCTRGATVTVKTGFQSVNPNNAEQQKENSDRTSELPTPGSAADSAGGGASGAGLVGGSVAPLPWPSLPSLALTDPTIPCPGAALRGGLLDRA